MKKYFLIFFTVLFTTAVVTGTTPSDSNTSTEVKKTKKCQMKKMRECQYSKMLKA